MHEADLSSTTNNGNPTKKITYNTIAGIIGLALIVLLTVARFAFGLPREIAAASTNLIMAGWFLFMVVDPLRTNHRVAVCVHASNV